MKLLLFVDTVLLFLNSLCSIYLWALGLFGIRVQQRAPSERYNRFAILVTAHNEEQTIDTLIASLKALDYPKELYDCYFGADHCSDKTAERIKKQDFICYEKTDGYPGKARMLSWLTKKILEDDKKTYHAIVYFDADDRVDPEFLKIINDSLNAGNEIVQGNSNVLNWNDSTFTVINHINVIATNRLKENGRRNAGLSCYLRGHAMCFKTEVLEEFDWADDSLVEDEELFLRLILKGKKIIWEHQARVDNRILSSTAVSKNQRLRWSKGKLKLLKEKTLPMLRNLLKNFNWVSLDALLVLLMPTYSILVGLSILTFILSFLFFKNSHLMLWWSSGLVLSYLSYFSFGCILEQVPFRIFFHFLVSPIFIFWRMWIYLLSLRKVKVERWR